MKPKKPFCLFSSDEAEEALLLVLLHLATELPVADRLIADKVDLVDLDLRPFRHMERDVDELGPALDVLDLGPDFGELIPLRCIELADDAGDASNEPRIDERVEPDRDALLFQRFLDLRLVDLLQTFVVDDLDPLPLLHVVDDHLADDAVGEGVVLDPDCQVIEEVGGPQPLEVFANDLLDGLVVRHPLPGLGVAEPRLHLDVIEVGIGFDHREAALLFEAGDDLIDHRPRARWRERSGSRDGLTANGLSGLGRCSGRGWRPRPASEPGGSGGRQRSEEKQEHTHRSNVEPSSRRSPAAVSSQPGKRTVKFTGNFRRARPTRRPCRSFRRKCRRLRVSCPAGETALVEFTAILDALRTAAGLPGPLRQDGRPGCRHRGRPRSRRP